MASELDVQELLDREGYSEAYDLEDRAGLDSALSHWFWQYCRKRDV
jgi:hypothetical protein